MGDKEETSFSSGNSLTSKFSDFFIEKSIIHATNVSMNETVLVNAGVAFEGQRLTQLELSSQDEVCNIVKSVSKSCLLDPLGKYLLKQVLDHVLPLITVIIHKSLVESTLPICFKKADVRPLLEKVYVYQRVLKTTKQGLSLHFCRTYWKYLLSFVMSVK